MGRTVLIADDHAGFRRLAGRLLSRFGYVIVGEAHDAASAVDGVEALRPDILLLDVQLPDADGFSVAARVADAGTAIVLVSSRDAQEYGSLLPAPGASGFIAKRDLTGAAVSALVGPPA